MSPPWGGPSYSASTFEVNWDVGGLGCNMHQLLASAFSLLPEGELRVLSSVASNCAAQMHWHWSFVCTA